MLTTSTLSSSLMRRTFNQGDFVPHGPNSIRRIETGIVRTSMWNDGTRTISSYWGPNDMVGQPLSCAESYHMEFLIGSVQT